ncbi:MAG: hypothetical protein A3H28_08520 [Acidobacteria bacterium RIFCSPLOWO2_02_FULL_61_28]|nr:MAG: hypothetical protein A3H28_08520 [Acidobacteria bacterium RIFCSPLOWO2_02_FULL_61_28]
MIKRPARKWRSWRTPLLVLLATLATAWLAPAQEETAPPEEEKPPQLGPYQVSASGSIGNRFVTVNGNRAKYNQLLNLHDGFRVFSGDLAFHPVEAGQGWFDRLSITTQNLGGDPFPVLRVALRKNGVYELTAGYRATQYFYDLPQTDFTPNRGWLDRRRFADVELRYTPFRNVRLRFFYNRTEREGNDLATGPFFYFPQAANVWGAFGRADRTAWAIPLREEANLYGGGIDVRWKKTDLHLEQSYRTYNNPANLQGFAGRPVEVLGPGSPARNIVITRWDSLAEFNIPMTSLRVEQEVTSRLRLRAAYLYQHASGPTRLNGSVQVPLPETPAGATVNYAGTGSTDMTSHTSEAGFTLKLFEALDLISDYRYQTYTQTGRQSLTGSRTDFPAPVPLGDNTLRWDSGLHTLDTLLALTPYPTLSLRAGLRFLKQDVVRKEDGRIAPGTRRSWAYSPVINASFKPSSMLRLTGQFEQRTAVDPYVRISPESTVGSNVRVRFYPSDRWGIDNTFSFRNQETDLLDFQMRSRTNSTSLWFQPLSQLGLNAGFTYSRFRSENTVRYLRGTPPLTGLLSTDQTIDRSYFWGIQTRPAANLTLSFSGQFIRATGRSTFSGESSSYGPLTWPAWNTEIAYQTQSVGRLVFGWQRSYYLEDLFRATDFRANAFQIRWDFSF